MKINSCLDILIKILIILFVSCRFVRVGSIVLALHDGSDVFLEVGKMSKYSGAEGLAGISFVLFMLSWLILRLIIYPFWILWSTRLDYNGKYMFLMFKYLIVLYPKKPLEWLVINIIMTLETTYK